jgi:8-oxo-dGTP diphosphatase
MTTTQPKDRFKLIPAVYLLLRRDNEVLLLRRAHTGYQDGNYSLVAGHLDGDELASTAMIREAEEEAGITVTPEDLHFVHLAHRLGRNDGQERVDIFFEATKWTGEVTNMEPHKCDDLAWFEIDHLPNNMLPFVARVLKDIDAGVHYSEYTEEPA